MKSFLVGRSKECEVVIADPTVSRRHAEFIVKSETEFVLVDCGSKFGTFLRHGDDWKQVTSTPVKIDDRIRLGQHETSIRTIMSVVLEGLRRTTAAAVAPEPVPVPPPVKSTPDPLSQPPSSRKVVVERDPETGEIISRK